MSNKLRNKVKRIQIGDKLGKIVLLEIADEANDQGVYGGGFRHLVKTLEMSRASVFRGINYLVSKKILYNESETFTDSLFVINVAALESQYETHKGTQKTLARSGKHSTNESQYETRKTPKTTESQYETRANSQKSPINIGKTVSHIETRERMLLRAALESQYETHTHNKNSSLLHTVISNKKNTDNARDARAKNSRDSASVKKPRPRDLEFELFAEFCFGIPADKLKILSEKQREQINKELGEMRDLELRLEYLPDFFSEFWLKNWRSKNVRTGQTERPRPAQIRELWFDFITSPNIAAKRREIEEITQDEVNNAGNTRKEHDFSKFNSIQFIQ